MNRPPPKTLDVPTFAEELGVSTKAVRAAIADGSLKRVPIGRTIRIPISELERMICPAPASPPASSSSSPAADGMSSGTTDDGIAALQRARETAQRLKRRSRLSSLDALKPSPRPPRR